MDYSQGMSLHSDCHCIEIDLMEEKLGAIVWDMVKRLARVGTGVIKSEVDDVVRAAIQTAD